MNKSIPMIALALAASALTTFAQAPSASATPFPPTGEQRECKRPHSPLIAALDANGDGVIDAQEIANAPAALKTLDKNGDGKLTRDELRPPRPEVKREGKKGGKGGMKHERQPLIAALDANGDGVIDAQEIANAPAALKTLDKNGDGKLTRDEYRRHRPSDETGTQEGRKHGKKDKGGAVEPAPSPSPVNL